MRLGVTVDKLDEADLIKLQEEEKESKLQDENERDVWIEMI